MNQHKMRASEALSLIDDDDADETSEDDYEINMPVLNENSGDLSGDSNIIDGSNDLEEDDEIEPVFTELRNVVRPERMTGFEVIYNNRGNENEFTDQSSARPSSDAAMKTNETNSQCKGAKKFFGKNSCFEWSSEPFLIDSSTSCLSIMPRLLEPVEGLNKIEEFFDYILGK